MAKSNRTQATRLALSCMQIAMVVLVGPHQASALQCLSCSVDSDKQCNNPEVVTCMTDGQPEPNSQCTSHYRQNSTVTYKGCYYLTDIMYKVPQCLKYDTGEAKECRCITDLCNKDNQSPREFPPFGRSDASAMMLSRDFYVCAIVVVQGVLSRVSAYSP